MTQRGRRLLVVVALSLAGAAMLLAGPGSAGAAPNPPGNNGTIKLDDTPFDDHPDNEPHLGCVFQVDFYGYDQGDLDATVTFQAHPPTGPVVTLLDDTVFLGEDDNSGGGSQAGLDASETYTLDFPGIEPHPQQGFHVKLTIHAEGSQGADVKHKVFWVTGCPPAPTTTSGGTTMTSGATSTSTATSTTGASSTSGETSTSKETTTTAAVGGSSSSAPGGSLGGDSSTPGGGALPFTGAAGLAMPMVAIALLGVGAASLLAGSRGRRRT